jgi:hypothetical protein
MNRDAFSASEAEFLSFAGTFHEGTNANATLLSIPAVLVNEYNSRGPGGK